MNVPSETLSGALYPPDGAALPEGEGAAGDARVLCYPERQSAAEHGDRPAQHAQRGPAQHLQVSSLFFLCNNL